MELAFNKIYLYSGECNTYYIDDAKKVQVDAGIDTGKPVELLIITHLHPDHALFASQIKKRTGCKVLVGESDVNNTIKSFPSWLGRRVKSFAVDGFLHEGDVVDAGTYKFKVLSVPGHLVGSIALFEEKHKILFSGDTIFPNSDVGRTDLALSEPGKMNDSIKRLRELKYEVLMAGHGEIETRKAPL